MNFGTSGSNHCLHFACKRSRFATLAAILLLVFAQPSHAAFSLRASSSGSAAAHPKHPRKLTLRLNQDDAELEPFLGEGDEVSWQDADGSPLLIQFTTSSPCQMNAGLDAPTSYCKIASKGQYYKYVCAKKPCVDPGLNPTSGTSPKVETLGVSGSRRGMRADPRKGIQPSDTGAGMPQTAPARLAAASSETVGFRCHAGQPPIVQASQPVYVAASTQINFRAPGPEWKFVLTLPADFCNESKSGSLKSIDGRAVCTAKSTPPSGIGVPFTLKLTAPSDALACNGDTVQSYLLPPPQ